MALFMALSRPRLPRPTLRTQLRARRNSLSAAAQRCAARRLQQVLLRRPEFLRARHIALYWPADGEIDPRPLLRLAWRLGKHCYMPCLAAWPRRHLFFVRYRPTAPLHRNRYGIPEPGGPGARPRALPGLDLLLMPLVGFDGRGNRLGMGGGFYDRTLAPLRGRRDGPLLVGLAHACQEVPALPVASWDVPLQAIATDRGFVRFR